MSPLARALPALVLAVLPLGLTWAFVRRARERTNGESGRVALLGAMTFALAAALELGVGRVLQQALEERVLAPWQAAVAIGLVVALAHEPLRFFTYRSFLPDRTGAGRADRTSALVYGAGWGAAMASLAAFGLLTAAVLTELGGEGVRDLGFGKGLAHRADVRAAFADHEPWRVWLMALDALAWSLFAVGLARLAARGRLLHLALTFGLHAVAVTSATLARDGALDGLVPAGLVAVGGLLAALPRPTEPPRTEREEAASQPPPR